MNLPHPDWLYHRLDVTGPAGSLEAFRAAAAGAGIVPWTYRYTEITEAWFLWLLSLDRRRRVPVARALAGELRDAVEVSHEAACEWVGRSKGCAFDLHALIPVPGDLALSGPDDPAVLAWLWEHWGTTWPLRHVKRLLEPPAYAVEFFSADWSPWPAIAVVRLRYPDLRFDLTVRY